MSAHRKHPTRVRERILMAGSVLIIGGLLALAVQAVEVAVLVVVLGMGVVAVAVFA